MSRDIPLTLIDTDPNQPRQHFDPTTLDELAQSMAANGLIVPILVRPVGERFVLVHGERRWRAAQSLGWETIPAEVRDLSADDARWLALIENIQRADLSPIEEAKAYQRMLDTGVTQTELGKRVGKSQSHIATRLRFLKLPDDAQGALADGAITEGHAKQLLRIDDNDYITRLYHRIRNEDLTVNMLRQEVDQAVRIVEAQRLVQQSEWTYVSDDDLLRACGCEHEWIDVWEAESLRLCPDRLTGVFARMMYAFGQRDETTVYAYNFSGPGDVSFYQACTAMQRTQAADIGSADLIFVNIPPHAPDITEILETVYQQAKQSAVLVVRSGADHIMIREVSTTLNFGDVHYALAKAKYYIGVGIVCTLAPLPLDDDIVEKLERTTSPYNDNPIDVYEVWTSACMSRDILMESRLVGAALMSNTI